MEVDKKAYVFAGPKGDAAAEMRREREEGKGGKTIHIPCTEVGPGPFSILMISLPMSTLLSG